MYQQGMTQELEKICDVLEQVQSNIAPLPEQLKKLDCGDLDHSTHIRPLVAADYSLSSVIDDIQRIMETVLRAENKIKEI